MISFDEAPLIEFDFVSQAVVDLPDAAVLRIVRGAWSNNARNGLTGFMTFSGGKFHQLIEGVSEDVLPLVSRILTDRRHSGITINSLRPISKRRYSGLDFGQVVLGSGKTFDFDSSSACIDALNHFPAKVAHSSYGCASVCAAP